MINFLICIVYKSHQRERERLKEVREHKHRHTLKERVGEGQTQEARVMKRLKLRSGQKEGVIG